MNNPLDKVYLSKTNLENIANGGSITSGDDTYTGDENTLYLVPDEIGDLVQTTGQSTTDVMSQKAVTDAIKSGEGKSGSITIQVLDWVNNVATKTITDLGNNDLISFYPSTIADKTNIANADIFVSANNNVVTFTATNTPQESITFIYFITRGAV